MKEVLTIASEFINDLRQQVTSLWLKPDILDINEGWSVSKMDAALVLQLFESLRLSGGFNLYGFQFREASSGHGIILALPDRISAESLLKNFDTEDHAQYFPLRYIESDQSALSYFLKSLFIRECMGFGEWGHGVNWMNHHFLDDRMEPFGFNGSTLPSAHDENWLWLKSKPPSFNCTVVFMDGRVTVSFYTIQIGNNYVIKHHQDIFTTEKPIPDSEENVIATF